MERESPMDDVSCRKAATLLCSTYVTPSNNFTSHGYIVPPEDIILGSIVVSISACHY
jgi:hypothetical protein